MGFEVWRSQTWTQQTHEGMRKDEQAFSEDKLRGVMEPLPKWVGSLDSAEPRVKQGGGFRKSCHLVV